jgi:hypothetical protein
MPTPAARFWIRSPCAGPRPHRQERPRVLRWAEELRVRRQQEKARVPHPMQRKKGVKPRLSLRRARKSKEPSLLAWPVLVAGSRFACGMVARGTTSGSLSAWRSAQSERRPHSPASLLPLASRVTPPLRPQVLECPAAAQIRPSPEGPAGSSNESSGTAPAMQPTALPSEHTRRMISNWFRRMGQARWRPHRAARRWSASMASRELRSSFSQWTVQSESAVSERTNSWIRRWYSRIVAGSVPFA